MNIGALSNEQYALLFGVRRSIRYHDRRRAFFERLHRFTSALTILLAGSVLFDIAGAQAPWWLLMIGAFSALLAATDMVLGYANHAEIHRDLRSRFADLEVCMLSGGSDNTTWLAHKVERLRIERDEPPAYRALDLLCHNELMLAEGYRPDSEYVAKVGWFRRATCNVFHWPNVV